MDRLRLIRGLHERGAHYAAAMPTVSVSASDDDAVRTLVLDRPQARNAMDTMLLGELLDALSDAVADDGVKVIVFAGAGGAFSAGADLREQLDDAGRMRRQDLFNALYEAVASCPKPTVAALAGPAVGGGAELAAACDVRVADRTASVRFPGAALGIPVGAAKLVGLVGLGAAKDLVFTSRTVAAEEAHHLGLVQRLVDAGDALRTAQEVAAAIAANDQPTVRYLKRQFDRFSGVGDRIQAENDALHAVFEAGGDLGAVALRADGVGSWAGGTWARR